MLPENCFLPLGRCVRGARFETKHPVLTANGAQQHYAETLPVDASGVQCFHGNCPCLGLGHLPFFFPGVAYRLESSVVVELGGDLLPHVGEDGGDHDEAAGSAEAEGVRERRRKGGLVEVKALGSLVHDEEHFAFCIPRCCVRRDRKGEGVSECRDGERKEGRDSRALQPEVLTSLGEGVVGVF